MKISVFGLVLALREATAGWAGVTVVQVPLVAFMLAGASVMLARVWNRSAAV